MRFYRIHSSTEALGTVLDPRRPDGWVASDEEYESQPRGVSCCADLDDLRRYCELYSLTPQPGDVLLALDGYLSGDEDRDQYAQRVIVERYEVIGDACAWLRGEDEDEDEDEE